PWGNNFGQYQYPNGPTDVLGSGKNISWVGAQDMTGIVDQWVKDWYSETYYQSSPVNDPTGPHSGSGRVLRGHSCIDAPPCAFTFFRTYSDPGSQGPGFRLMGTLHS